MHKMISQSERLEFLVEQMKEDSIQYRDFELDDNYDEKQYEGV